MKYPITPDYLVNVPEPIIRLYSDLETAVLQDICRRFKLSGEATESAIQQIRVLRSRGMDMSYIDRYVQNTLRLSKEEYSEIFNRAVKRNRAYYDDKIDKSKIVEARFSFEAKEREFESIRQQTQEQFTNITQSLGFAMKTARGLEFLPIAKAYQKILDDAEIQVWSGAVDYNTAVKNAVKRLTDSGLQTVDYSTGWHNRVDVAARRAVMTGVSQLSAQYSEAAAEVLETELREVTAHRGARDTGTGWQNHKNWQGKVYCVNPGHPKYPDIHEVCGLGAVDGLEGANCRHHHFPFVEGVSERTWTDKQLESIDPPPFEYQGRKYTAYEATQKQRQIETSMRKCKRELIGYGSAGLMDDYQDSAIRLNRLSEEYRKFSASAGLRTQPERARVQGFGSGEAARARASANK